MTLDTMRLALKTLQHVNEMEHPVHATVLPGEIELAIESLHRAIESHVPVAWYHSVSGRVRLQATDNLPPSWVPLYKD